MADKGGWEIGGESGVGGGKESGVGEGPRRGLGEVGGGSGGWERRLRRGGVLTDVWDDDDEPGAPRHLPQQSESAAECGRGRGDVGGEGGPTVTPLAPRPSRGAHQALQLADLRSQSQLRHVAHQSVTTSFCVRLQGAAPGRR